MPAPVLLRLPLGGSRGSPAHRAASSAPRTPGPSGRTPSWGMGTLMSVTATVRAGLIEQAEHLARQAGYGNRQAAIEAHLGIERVLPGWEETTQLAGLIEWLSVSIHAQTGTAPTPAVRPRSHRIDEARARAHRRARQARARTLAHHAELERLDAVMLQGSLESEDVQELGRVRRERARQDRDAWARIGYPDGSPYENRS